jgi:hypothetical protein
MVPSTPPFRRSASPAERSNEFAAHQKRLKEEAASRRRKAAAAASPASKSPRGEADREAPPEGR